MTNGEKITKVFGEVPADLLMDTSRWLGKDFDGPEQLTVNVMKPLREDGVDDNEQLTIELPAEPVKQDGDVVAEPEHYKHSTYEAIDEMIIVFGPEKTLAFCELSAWKYRNRAAYKGNFEQDMAKADQYIKMANDIRERNGMAIGRIKGRCGNHGSY